LEQRLEFFKKDTIDWDGYEYEDFYRTLFELKDRNEALWNGQHGGHFQHVPTSPSENIYAYKRVKGDSEVLVVLNFTGQEQQVALQDISPTEYSEVFSGETLTVGKEPVAISAHSHLVLEK
jgi:glycosidase